MGTLSAFIDVAVAAALAGWAFACTADFLGMVCGVTGTLLLACKGRLAGWGFVAFLASNVGWILFALDHNHTKLLVQHVIFAISSLVGVWVWLVGPAVDRAFERLYARAGGW